MENKPEGTGSRANRSKRFDLAARDGERVQPAPLDATSRTK